VAVNHVWMRHFGRPLVPSVFDFGLNGKPPSHPQLLDWLAVEFMEHGWRFKHLHRLMVTSEAYRRSSAIADFGFRIADSKTPANPQSEIRNPQFLDPDNIYLWRMNTRRMEAEVVRDSLLHVAGKLNLTMGGPELDQNLGLTTFRRSVYYRHAMEKQMTFLKIFDIAGPTECYRRTHTIVPQHALALANSSLALDAARTTAGNLAAEIGSPADAAANEQFIIRAFRRVLCREPSAEERTACHDFLSDQARLLANGKALRAVDGAPPPIGDPQKRARENLVHVLLNHHEFVMIR
jgi:hypothetical protein